MIIWFPAIVLFHITRSLIEVNQADHILRVARLASHEAAVGDGAQRGTDVAAFVEDRLSSHGDLCRPEGSRALVRHRYHRVGRRASYAGGCAAVGVAGRHAVVPRAARCEVFVRVLVAGIWRDLRVGGFKNLPVAIDIAAIVGIELRTDLDLVVFDLGTGAVVSAPLQCDPRLSVHERKEIGGGRRGGVREVLHANDPGHDQGHNRDPPQAGMRRTKRRGPRLHQGVAGGRRLPAGRLGSIAPGHRTHEGGRVHPQ